MKQGRHFIDPRLHVKATATVQYDNCSGIQLRRILDQVVLKFREPERAIMVFAIILLVPSNGENHRIIVGECRRGLQRRPAHLQAGSGE